MLLCIFDMPHTHSLHPKATGHVCVHDYIYYMFVHTHTCTTPLAAGVTCGTEMYKIQKNKKFGK
jgi:hypothetical protein